MSLFDQIACRGKAKLFFPEGVKGPKPPGSPGDKYARGRTICAECPVQAACREYGLGFTRRGDRLEGLFGGLDEFERAELVRRERRRSA